VRIVAGALAIGSSVAFALGAMGCGSDEAKRGGVPDAGRATDGGSGGTMAGNDAARGGSGGAATAPADGGRAAADGSPPESGPRDADRDDGTLDAGVDVLSDTGLTLPGTETLAPGVRPFTPRFKLWSDGATKRRFLYLPPGGRIDTSRIDDWVFPVGTKVWKEFTRDGVRVETRLLEKTSSGWNFIAYAWNAEQTRAVAVPDGVRNALGTPHDIPGRPDCFGCHSGSADFLLGVSAVQLAWGDGADGGGGAPDASPADAGAQPELTVADLQAEGLLTDPVPASIPLPGDPVTQRALGVLHANCGHCHRPNTFVWERAQMDLHLTALVGSDPTSVPAYTTSAGVAPARLFDDGDLRIAPGDPSRSAVYFRMASRDPALAMPPIASELVDTTGAADVRAWISGL